jgi:hypothetical protein
MEDNLWVAMNAFMMLRAAVPRVAARFLFPQVSPVPGYGRGFSHQKPSLCLHFFTVTTFWLIIAWRWLFAERRHPTPSRVFCGSPPMNTKAQK